MAQKPDGKPARVDRVAFTKSAADRIGKAVRKVEAGNRDQAPLTFGSHVSQPHRPFRYFRLTSDMTPCQTANASRVQPVCCGQGDLRMDLVDLDEPEPDVVIFDHLGSARIYNVTIGERRNAVIPSGTYCLARWVSFTDTEPEASCGAAGVWELVGFLPCAAAACGQPASSGSSEALDSSQSYQPPSSGSWRSSASQGSQDCVECLNEIEVVTDVNCDSGDLTVEKTKIEARECCGSGS